MDAINAVMDYLEFHTRGEEDCAVIKREHLFDMDGVVKRTKHGLTFRNLKNGEFEIKYKRVKKEEEK